MVTYWGVEVKFNIFLTSALDGGELSVSTPATLFTGQESLERLNRSWVHFESYLFRGEVSKCVQESHLWSKVSNLCL